MISLSLITMMGVVVIKRLAWVILIGWCVVMMCLGWGRVSGVSVMVSGRRSM